MASEASLNVIITALDKTAAPLHEINERFRRMGEPLRQIHDRLGRIGEASGMTRLAERTREAFEHVRHLGRELFEIAGPLAALAGVGTIAGLVEMTKQAAEFGKFVHLGASMTGLSTEALGGWLYAAQRAGIESQRFNRGVTMLNRSMSDAVHGKNRDVAEIFARLGRPLALGHLPQTGEALGLISNEVERLIESGNLPLATAMLSKLMGSRSGMMMLPLFEQGMKGLQWQLEAAKKYGIAPTKEQAEASDEAAKSWDNLGASVQGFKNTVGYELNPVLTPLVNRMADFLAEHRVALGRQLASTMRDFGDAMKNVDFAAITRGLQEAFAWTKWLLHDFLGVKGVLLAIAGISFGPLIFSLGLVAAAALRVGATIALALGSNPFGAALLGAAALGLAAYEAYAHWDQVGPYFANVFRNMGNTALAAWELIRAFSEMVARDVLTGWENDKTVFGDIFRFIEARWHDSVGAIKQDFSDLKLFFTELWTNIGKAFDDIWLTKIKPVTDAMHEAIQWFEDHLPGFQALSGGGGGGGGAAGGGASEGWGHWIGRHLGLVAPATGSGNAKMMAEWLSSHGYDVAHAAAIMGNAQIESGFRPTAVGPGNHRGLFQWEPARWMGGDFAAQMRHMDEELQKLDPGFKKAAGDAGELAARFEHFFERSGGQLLAGRVSAARGFAAHWDALASKAQTLDEGVPPYLGPRSPQDAHDRLVNSYADALDGGFKGTIQDFMRSQGRGGETTHHAKVTLHVGTEKGATADVKGVETTGNPDLDLSLGPAFAF